MAGGDSAARSRHGCSSPRRRSPPSGGITSTLRDRRTADSVIVTAAGRTGRPAPSRDRPAPRRGGRAAGRSRAVPATPRRSGGHHRTAHDRPLTVSPTVRCPRSAPTGSRPGGRADGGFLRLGVPVSDAGHTRHRQPCRGGTARRGAPPVIAALIASSRSWRATEAACAACRSWSRSAVTAPPRRPGARP